jgi:hypothetical protein
MKAPALRANEDAYADEDGGKPPDEDASLISVSALPTDDANADTAK